MTKTMMLLLVPVLCAGCIHVKTENEIKPIHITMDVNLKVDNALNEAFKDENFAAKPQSSGDAKQPPKEFVAMKAMLDRGAAGISSNGLLVARDGATDDDKLLIFDSNERYNRRLADVAQQSGVSLETVQKRRAAQFVERIPAGSGVWYQDESGSWKQK